MLKEKDLHLTCATHLRYAYPEVIFTSDFGAGLKLPIWLARRQRQLRSGKSYPDIFIAEARGDFHGMFIELKRDGEKIYKRDGTVRASKDDRLQLQHDMLEQLRERGYYATFVPGFYYFMQYTEWYLDGAHNFIKPWGPELEWPGKLLNKSSSTEVKDDLPF